MYDSEYGIIETNGVRNYVKSLYKRQRRAESFFHLSLSMYCVIHSALHYKTSLKERRGGNKRKKT